MGDNIKMDLTQDVRMWIGVIYLRTGTSSGLLWICDESSGLIKVGIGHVCFSVLVVRFRLNDRTRNGNY